MRLVFLPHALANSQIFQHGALSSSYDSATKEETAQSRFSPRCCSLSHAKLRPKPGENRFCSLPGQLSPLFVGISSQSSSPGVGFVTILTGHFWFWSALFVKNRVGDGLGLSGVLVEQSEERSRPSRSPLLLLRSLRVDSTARLLLVTHSRYVPRSAAWAARVATRIQLTRRSPNASSSECSSPRTRHLVLLAHPVLADAMPIQSLPEETLLKILSLAGDCRPNDSICGTRYATLRRASLVCRNWRILAQALLWKVVRLEGSIRAVKFLAASAANGYTTTALELSRCVSGLLRGQTSPHMQHSEAVQLIQLSSGLEKLKLSGFNDLDAQVLYMPGLAGEPLSSSLPRSANATRQASRVSISRTLLSPATLRGPPSPSPSRSSSITATNRRSKRGHVSLHLSFSSPASQPSTFAFRRLTLWTTSLTSPLLRRISPLFASDQTPKVPSRRPFAPFSPPATLSATSASSTAGGRLSFEFSHRPWSPTAGSAGSRTTLRRVWRSCGRI